MMGVDLKELQSLIDSLDKMVQESSNKTKENNATSSTEKTEQEGIINSIKNVINQ